jgi:hypothetical protein
MEKFATNDLVFITFEGRTVPGKVLLASENGQSLMLIFDAMLGGYVATMPVLWRPESRLPEDNGEFTDLIKGLPVTITRMEDHVG